MFNTGFDMEVAQILRQSLRAKGLKGKALTKEVLSYIQGNKVDMESINAQIEAEAVKYKELSGKETSKTQKKIRLRELLVKSLPITQEEKQEAEALARSNIFTDDRGGIIATLANAIGWAANRHPILGAVIKPYVPFTKIVGNVTEFMLDHTPVYGFLRANGMSISALKRLYDPDIITAQMGKKGSNLYYEQMGRAYLGTISFAVLMAIFLGGDDDDEDGVKISGGYNQEGFKKGGRENIMPKYSIRIKGVDISYLNIPSLAIPLGIIGNLNDALRAKLPEEEITLRLTASMLATASKETAFMIKDMSFVTGTQNLINMISDATSMEESNFKRVASTMAKSYLGFGLRPLPWNSALVQQT
jgi:hypothetical protein